MRVNVLDLKYLCLYRIMILNKIYVINKHIYPFNESACYIGDEIDESI